MFLLRYPPPPGRAVDFLIFSFFMPGAHPLASALNQFFKIGMAPPQAFAHAENHAPRYTFAGDVPTPPVVPPIP